MSEKMMRVKIIELVKEHLEHLGLIALQPYLLPSVGDKLYFKGVDQLTVIERHFNIMADSRYDVELFVQKTSSIVPKLSGKEEEKKVE